MLKDEKDSPHEQVLASVLTCQQELLCWAFVEKCQRMAVHRAKLEQTRFHHKETLGKRLRVSMAMENALTKQWTHITEVCDKANGGKDPDDHRT